MNQEYCDCGSKESYQACCRPYLMDRQMAPTPEKLMRSRYTAFCRGQIDYLIKTHHPSQRESDDATILGQTIHQTEWLGLRVLKTDSPGTIQDAKTQSSVEFVAFYRDKMEGNPGQLHEKSEFVWEDGRWYYLQGEQLEPITIKRNEPCWCGSNKKYKKCHG